MTGECHLHQSHTHAGQTHMNADQKSARTAVMRSGGCCVSAGNASDCVKTYGRRRANGSDDDDGAAGHRCARAKKGRPAQPPGAAPAAAPLESATKGIICFSDSAEGA